MMNVAPEVVLPRLLVAEATEEVNSMVDVCEKRNTTRTLLVKLYKFIIVTALAQHNVQYIITQTM